MSPPEDKLVLFEIRHACSPCGRRLTANPLTVRFLSLVTGAVLIMLSSAMRRGCLNRPAEAVTLIEVLVVIAVVVVSLLFAVATHDHRTKSPTTQCSNNLGQIGVGLHAFATDHGDHFPPQVSVGNGGSMEFIGRGSPAAHFQTLSNEMRLKVWICPTDEIKKPANNYAAFDDRNLSYFLSMDAAPTNTQPQFIILAGDRHLEVAGQPVRPGLFTFSSNTPVSWTRELHRDASQSRGGVVLFVDGHVEFLKHDRVVAAVKGQGLGTNRLAVP